MPPYRTIPSNEEPQNPTQFFKSVGFHYRSTQPTLRSFHLIGKTEGSFKPTF
jgi:hypothetical protein